MNEAESYKWAEKAMRCADNLIEPHKGQQLADAVASAILEAYAKGFCDDIDIRPDCGCWIVEVEK